MLHLCQKFTEKNNEYEITPIFFKDEFVFLPQEVEKQLGVKNIAESIRKSKGIREGVDYYTVDGEEFNDLRRLLLNQGLGHIISPKARRTYLIKESGLLAFFFKSNKDEYVDFRVWITDEVIPELLKNGKYSIVSTKSKYEELASHLELSAKLVRELEKEDDKKWEIIKRKDEMIVKLTDDANRNLQIRQLELRNKSGIKSIKKAAIREAPRKILEKYKPLIRTYAEAHNSIYNQFKTVTGINLKKLYKDAKKEPGNSQLSLQDFILDNSFDGQYLSIVEDLVNIEENELGSCFDSDGNFIGA